MGALAIWESSWIAGEILNASLKSIPIAMSKYDPDGGWVEGPMYHSYATRYQTT